MPRYPKPARSNRPKPVTIPSSSAWPITPFEDYDEYWIGHPPMGGSEIIEEEDDEETIRSALVGPNGEPILYHAPSSKLGFIGFVSPDLLEAIAHAKQSPKRKRRRRKNAGTE